MTEKPPIRVPSRALPTMNRLVSLDEEGRKALHSALVSEPMPISIEALRERLATVLGEDGPRAARDLVGELFGLANVAQTHGYDLEGVAESVAETPGLNLAGPERESFAAFFGGLLRSSAVSTLGKAASLAGEHERLFHSVRVVTDVTPIFDEPDEDPIGGLVMHRLRISYWGTAHEDEVEIALNTAQLSELAAAVSRAETKAASINNVLGRLSLPSFDTQGER